MKTGNMRQLMSGQSLYSRCRRETRAIHRAIASPLRVEWGALSVQVLQEFHVNVTRKLKTRVASSIAREVVAYRPWVRAPTTVDTIIRASQWAEIAQISFWNAMIMASAEDAGAEQIYTEDLNPGQLVAGILVVNPLTAT